MTQPQKLLRGKSSISTTESAHALIHEYNRVRAFSEELCSRLKVDDFVIQSMPDVSPTKWHLAHVSWFWETFVLGPADIGHKSPNPLFAYLYNSYYNAVGPQFSRPRRGLISRPTVEETYAYRHHVDEAMREFLGSIDEAELQQWAPIINLGLNHEQQHQELILTDIKHVLAQNPLYPAYAESIPRSGGSAPPLHWISFPEGLHDIGYEGNNFFFDNEGPRHRQYLECFELASRLVTSDEFLNFMEDGGYRRPELWLSDGWAMAQTEDWRSPLYWIHKEEGWWQMTLQGLRRIEESEHVCHVSYYEADAYARWAGARLPAEAEWEVAASDLTVKGNFVEDGHFHPVSLDSASIPGSLHQMYGDVWEWTQSPYTAYPGFRPAAGAIGENNGKFMCNQLVLRGGSCATSITHIRPTYRNFFPPHARWQFMGIRLARDTR